MKVILLASTFVLFAVFSQGGVQKCYFCNGDCMDVQKLEEKTCGNTNDYLCYAWSEIEPGNSYVKTERKCVPNTEKSKEDCRRRKNDTASCYTCDSDLCNKEIQAEEHFKKRRTEEDKKKQAELNTFKCYVCEGKCEQPEEKKCDIEGATVYSCQAMATRTNGGVMEIRNCVSRTNEIKENCKARNDKQGHGCYLCNTMLCNNRPAIEDDEPSTRSPTSTPSPPSTPEGVEGVQKCYFCKWGLCKNPEIVSCDDKRPTDFLCMYVVASDGTIQRCVPNNRRYTSYCENVPKKPGGISCYTCSTNLCNKEAQQNYLHPPDKDEGEGRVTECYTCWGQCDEPRKVKCDVRQYLCAETRKRKDDGTTEYWRKCIPKTDSEIQGCEQIDKKIPGATCQLCDKDLCNNKYSEGTERPDMEEQYNTAAIYSPQAMLLTTLISQFLTKLSSM